MKEKNRPLSFVALILLIILIMVIVLGIIFRADATKLEVSDGITEIDLNTIYLEGSGIEVSFSDVILSDVKESRKLIVAEKDAEVSTILTDRIIQKMDFDFMKKTQTVTYKGTGKFVVDLDNLTKANIIEDKDHKTVTIKIDHAYLEDISINPEDVIIDEVKESLLARGNIELTISDFNSIEKELLAKIDAKLNTAKNAQEADVIALEMVKDIYEPLIKAIDHRYDVIVEFK